MLIEAGYMQMSKVNFGVTGPEFTKFSHDVARSWPLLTRPSALRYFNPLWNARAMNDGE